MSMSVNQATGLSSFNIADLFPASETSTPATSSPTAAAAAVPTPLPPWISRGYEEDYYGLPRGFEQTLKTRIATIVNSRRTPIEMIQALTEVYKTALETFNEKPRNKFTGGQCHRIFSEFLPIFERVASAVQLPKSQSDLDVASKLRLEGDQFKDLQDRIRATTEKILKSKIELKKKTLEVKELKIILAEKNQQIAELSVDHASITRKRSAAGVTSPSKKTK